MFVEDIYNEAATTKDIYLIYGSYTVDNFDKPQNNNALKFLEIKERLNNKELHCFFSKKTDDEIFVIVPMEDMGGQVEFVVTYSNFFLEIKAKSRKKSRFNSNVVIPDLQYAFDQLCTIHFVEDTEKDCVSLRDLFTNEELAKKALKLEVAPVTQIENQKEIWTKYIEAQNLIISTLQKPYSCKTYYDPEISYFEDGETKRQIRFKVELNTNKRTEYSDFEDELKSQLNIEASFDGDGCVQLTYDEINRGLDSIIRKKFLSLLEREKKIGCILSIRPFNLEERITMMYPEHKFRVEQNGRFLLVSGIDSDIDEFSNSLAKDFNLIRTNRDYLEIHIKNVDNLFTSEHVDRYKISFGRAADKDSNQQELILPEPVNQTTFRVRVDLSKEISEQHTMLQNILACIYGKENVSRKILYAFSSEDNNIFNNAFSTENWNDIYRDLYALDFDITYGEGSGNTRTLYFEFETLEELETMYQSISDTNKFCVIKSPLDSDFKFKVKTNLLAQKSQKEIFRENLRKLNGVDFSVKVGDYEYVTIGKLVEKDSTMSQLVFRLPCFYDSDKKIAESFLKFINMRPNIREVSANLAGDRAKAKWLKDAMHKLSDNNPSNEPNGKPVNDKIKEFIFDSSKATPTSRYEFYDIEKCEEFINFDKTSILSLNDSQKKSVLRALNARDLCMLQGPPGTGKTTVIAELIWQHIRTMQNSRILLTSETNLAVDNALEKLMNGKNANPDMARYLTLIKPLRFGKSAKFEEEGKRYSIERIMEWLGKVDENVSYEDEPMLGENEDDAEEEELIPNSVNDNVVQYWMNRIADCSHANNDRYSDILKDWVVELSMPSNETRQYFTDKFFKYANVIGSTCSSTGSGSFAKEYNRIFNSNITYEILKDIKEIQFLMDNRPSSPKISRLIESAGLDYVETPAADNFKNLKEAINNLLTIRFDTVIMDEASKATPPELLMPLCFGRKSIIIGDHRQLPPMLYDKDFKEALLSLGDKKSADLSELIDKDFTETSQLKRLILNPKVSPTIKSTFNTQYRMHKDINDVIKQFYEDDESGGLECGLSSEYMDSSDLDNPESRYHGFSHEGFINDRVHTIWVNVNAPESSDGSSKVNLTEVEAMKRVIAYLKHSHGFNEYMKHWDTLKSDTKRRQEKEIGLISFYGKQVNNIKLNVKPFAQKLGIPVKLNTVDKFQGMERNIIIVSTVRSDRALKADGTNRKNGDPGFAKSPERLNVALSRARRLLIVIGNIEFFSGIKDREGKPLYLNAINEIRKTGRIIEFDDLKMYTSNE